MRERQRRAITTNISHGLRKHGGYPLSPRADINEVLRQLATVAGWVILPDGTTYRAKLSIVWGSSGNRRRRRSHIQRRRRVFGDSVVSPSVSHRSWVFVVVKPSLFQRARTKSSPERLNPAAVKVAGTIATGDDDV